MTQRRERHRLAWLVDEAFENIDGTFVILGAAFFTSLHRGEFVVGVIIGELLSVQKFFREQLGPIAVGHVGDGTHVQDDIAGVEAFGHFEGLERFTVGAGALRRVVGGVLIRVGRIDHDLGGRGEVIVHANTIKTTGIEGPLDPGELGDGHAVGKLHGVETQFEDFVDHVLAISVAGVVPAG